MRADAKFRSMIPVVKLLREDDAVSRLVGREKIFPIVAPENTDGDFIVYQRDGYERADTKMGVALQRSIFFIIAVSVDYNRSLDIGEAIYNALEGEHSEHGIRIRMRDYGEDFIDKKFFQILQFSIE